MEEIVKKIIVVVCTLLISVFSVVAEDAAFEVLGPETSYNQIRVINDTTFLINFIIFILCGIKFT